MMAAAPPVAALPPLPPGCAVESTTICVSGYPAVPAWRYVRDGQVVATLPRDAPMPWAAPPRTMHRCGSCNRVSWSPFPENALGLRNACAACAEAMTARCERRHGRVPAVGEFLCLRCYAICPDALRVPKRTEGRENRRWCTPCYHASVRQRMRRVRARRARPVGVRPQSG